MTTVRRKQLEQEVMKLQSLAMECAKSNTLHVFVHYSGHVDNVFIRASKNSAVGVDGVYEQVWLSASFVTLEESLHQLQHAYAEILAMHLVEVERMSDPDVMRAMDDRGGL